MTDYHYLMFGAYKIGAAEESIVFNWLKDVKPEATSLAAGHGNDVDAIRHGGIAALLSYDLGYSLTIKLGNALEEWRPGPGLENNQDYYNNELGARIGAAAKILGYSYEELGRVVKSAFSNGQFQLDAFKPQSPSTISLGNGVSLTASGDLQFADGSKILLSQSSIVFVAEDGVPEYASVTMVNADGTTQNLILDDEARLGLKRKVFGDEAEVQSHCFAAGTMIALANNSWAPIEEVRPGDFVLAFNASVAGAREGLIPSRVVRKFVREKQDVLRFHGLAVTEGHMFLSGDGKFQQLVKVLISDGIVVLADGASARARTNAPVGSEEDRAIPVSIAANEQGRVLTLRAGVPFARLEPNGPIYTLSARMAQEGYRLRDDGLFENDAGDVRMANWPWGDPREHPVARDYVVGEQWKIASAPAVTVN